MVATDQDEPACVSATVTIQTTIRTAEIMDSLKLAVGLAGSPPNKEPNSDAVPKFM